MDLLTGIGFLKLAIKWVRKARGALRDAGTDQHAVARLTAAIQAAVEKELPGHRGRYDFALSPVERKYAGDIAQKVARLFVAAYHNRKLDHDSLLDIGGYIDLLIDLRRGGDA